MRRLRHRRWCGGEDARLPQLGRGALPLLCFIWLLATAVSAQQDEVNFGSTKSDKEVEYGEPTAHTDRRDLPKSNETLERRITVLLDEMLKSHDKRIRPNYGGPPVEVNITALITTISAVSEVSMDYTLDLYLRQIWRDDRLAFPSDGPMSLTIGIDMVNQIWTPDTFFPNEKKSFFHEATSHNSFLRIDNHGNVLRSIRLTVTANCPMSLHTFPLDTQKCALEIESYGYSTKDIVYHWHTENTSLVMDENVHLAHFSVGKAYQIERVISLSTGNYSRLTAIFNFKRNIGFYLIQIYFPSSLIVVISWVSFWLNREAVQARVAIGVTTVLTMTTLMTSTNGSLPKVSYVKSLDIFLGVCFFIVFASLVEYAAVGYMLKRHRRRADAPSPVTYFESETSPNLQNGRMRNGNNRLRRNNNRSMKNSVNIPMDHLDAEHIVPLLVAVPVTRRPRFTIRPAQVDLASRFLFPLFFLIFQIIYWYWYFFSTMGSENQNDNTLPSSS
ncbi:lgc-38 [Pristionchus pacificus]|uniref:Gamma-aminobutyric acid receptor subunit beta n=1 Tax=Pristionchus pacificus TaxID=54126 RepID=A0A2A6CDE6_PRIPA|nr:lgc-38 [Pristionchus pacificus]|eukprot:PDM76265.1 lgc-38 [Pristionchus pacificus]